MSVKITGLDAVKGELAQSLKKTVDELAELVLVESRAHTPIKSGNARRNWTKKTTDKNFEVTNRVPYIERLEAGASRQAPKGIIGPTLDKIKGQV